MPSSWSFAALAALLFVLPARAQEFEEPQRAAPRSKHSMYTPSSHLFSCELPSAWQPPEDEDALGPVARLLGPDNPAGNYRTGFSVRWIEKGTPGYVEPQKAVEKMRRSDKETGRSSGGVSVMRVGGLLGRLFEVVETRTLPLERLPARDQALHHYLAVIPNGENYYLVRLSSTRDVYLDFREDWFRCLRTFRPIGR
ncbi:MAG: hypothetical protein HY926_00580 [Elusimicrobia bacterium]|nr:hypothetical protein [Elusimicrobiota bacterium]